MSSIVTHQGIVHYETYGTGAPVILLHGWLGSWGLWQPTMEALGHHYRFYALDFWGFGESGKKRDSYTLNDFIELVQQFMDALGMEAAPLVGHSMGGTTSLGVGIRYPERVTKICVIGSPMIGSSLSFPLQLAGMPGIGAMARNSPAALRLGLRLWAPFITRNAKAWYPMVVRDLSHTTVDSFFSSISSLGRADLTDQLGRIQKPVLGIYGLRDVIVNSDQSQFLQQGIPHARIELMPRSGHFPMLDEPTQYLATLQTFLDGV